MIYTLYGENEREIDKFIEKLIKGEGVESKVIYNYKESSIKDVLEEASYNDLFGSAKLVILNDSLFLTGSAKGEEEELLDYIENPNKNTIFVFKVVSEKLDERKKIVKLLKEKSTVKEFKLLNQYNIEGYINVFFKNAGKSIEPSAIKEIEARLISNPKVIDSELEKLLLYKYDSDKITLEDAKKTITKYEENVLFDLVNATIKNDKRRIFNTYKNLIKDKFEPAVIVSLLSSEYRLMYQVKVLSKSMNAGKIASLLKVHPYKVELSLKEVSTISTSVLKRLIKDLFLVDLNTKRGLIDKYMALEEFLIRI